MNWWYCGNWKIVINSAELCSAPCLVSFPLLNKEISPKRIYNLDMARQRHRMSSKYFNLTWKNPISTEAGDKWSQLCNIKKRAHFNTSPRTESILLLWIFTVHSSKHHCFRWIFWISFLFPLFQPPLLHHKLAIEAVKRKILLQVWQFWNYMVIQTYRIYVLFLLLTLFTLLF